MSADRFGSESSRGDRTKRPASESRPGHRKGRPNRLIEVDASTIERMPQRNPDDIRAIGRAFVLGDEILWAALRVADVIDETLNPERSAFDSSRMIAKQNQLAWANVAGRIVRRCKELEAANVQVFFRAIADALLLDRSRRHPSANNSRHRCSVVAHAYAAVWDTLITEGQKTRRPTHAEVREELERGRANLKAGNGDAHAIAELDAILRNRNLSRYSGSLKFQRAGDRGR